MMYIHSSKLIAILGKIHKDKVKNKNTTKLKRKKICGPEIKQKCKVIRRHGVAGLRPLGITSKVGMVRSVSPLG